MMDYTGEQHAPVLDVDRMPDHDESRETAQQAQRAYAIRYGQRPVDIHVKGTKREGGPWHFSPRWNQYLDWLDNICVFAVGTELVGWAYHHEILKHWKNCGAGHCFEGPLRHMDTFSGL